MQRYLILFKSLKWFNGRKLAPNFHCVAFFSSLIYDWCCNLHVHDIMMWIILWLFIIILISKLLSHCGLWLKILKIWIDFEVGCHRYFCYILVFWNGWWFYLSWMLETNGLTLILNFYCVMVYEGNKDQMNVLFWS